MLMPVHACLCLCNRPGLRLSLCLRTFQAPSWCGAYFPPPHSLLVAGTPTASAVVVFSVRGWGSGVYWLAPVGPLVVLLGLPCSGGSWMSGAQVSSMPASGPGGLGLWLPTPTIRHLHGETLWTQVHLCTQVFTPVCTDTHYLELLLPLKMSCIISAVCFSVTLSLLLIHVYCCRGFSAVFFSPCVEANSQHFFSLFLSLASPTSSFC